MPPSVSEVKLQNFRGNILDRQFPVQFDPQTGLYSYNYVNKNPGIADKLKTLKNGLKYYRKSSKSLAEIEADLAAYLKSQVSAPPPVKGEITQAAEAEEAKRKTVEGIIDTSYEKRLRGERLTPGEIAVTGEAQIERMKLERPEKYKYAQSELEKIYSNYNEKLARGEPVNIDPTTKRAKLSLADQAKANKWLKIIKASDQLEAYNNKVKNGIKLTPAELAIQRQSEQNINSFVEMPEPDMEGNIAEAINEKARYSAAKATYTQLKNKKNVTLNESNKFERAVADILKYERENPTVGANAQRQRILQDIELKRKKIKELEASTSPEDEALKTAYKARVDAYNAAVAASKPLANKESANLQVPGAKNIFNFNSNTFVEREALNEKGKYKGPNRDPTNPEKGLLVQGSTPVRELSNAAFANRQGKAQRVLNFFSSAAAPARLSNEQTKLRNNAQRIIQAFAKIANTSAKPANQNAARKTIKNSNFLNQARKLSIATEGGRRTRKVKRSRHKTYKRKH